MIPTVDFVVRLHARLASMGRVVGTCNETAILAMLRLASSLATTSDDEPAALLFACGRFPRAFGPGWVFLSAFLAEHQAAAVGRIVAFTPDELRALLGRVARQQDELADVSRWLEERSVRLPPSSSRAPRGQG